MRMYVVVWLCFAIPLNRDKHECHHSAFCRAWHAILFQINTKHVFWKNWFMGLVHFGTNLAITGTWFREPCNKQAGCHYDVAHLMSWVRKASGKEGSCEYVDQATRDGYHRAVLELEVRARNCTPWTPIILTKWSFKPSVMCRLVYFYTATYTRRLESP